VHIFPSERLQSAGVSASLHRPSSTYRPQDEKASGVPKPATVAFPNGAVVPALGQGTWMMGQGRHTAAEEIDALRLGIDLGLTLIDTAEMYGDGAAETLVGKAIAGQRERTFIVTKVLPSHGRRKAAIAACEASLRRLHIEQIDLYLLHWPGSAPLAETIGAFTTLQEQGKIAAWGVSNFDTEGMAEIHATSPACQTNQVLYNLGRRGIEFDLMPWCRDRAMPIMAYSPLEQGRLIGHPELAAVARRHSATEAQIALAWVLAQPGVIAIPKSGNATHVRENAAAAAIEFTAEDLALLDKAFPPPKKRQRLEML
jgi:diketogulonate reductase-like aldo/keto reductase